MSLDTDLQYKLHDLTQVPAQQNYNNEDDTQPRIWYQRQIDTSEVLLDGSSSLRDATFVVEVNALDPDAGAALAETIQEYFNGFRGSLGRTLILGCFVSNASDDYQFRGLDVDDGLHAFAFELRFLL